jgi:hypothetical protein
MSILGSNYGHLPNAQFKPRVREEAERMSSASLGGVSLQGDVSSTEEPQSTTALLFARIEHRVHTLAELTAILERKLGPVLASEGPQPGASGGSSTAATVPPTRFLATLEALEQMLDTRVMALSSVMNRVVL